MANCSNRLQCKWRQSLWRRWYHPTDMYLTSPQTLLDCHLRTQLMAAADQDADGRRHVKSTSWTANSLAINFPPRLNKWFQLDLRRVVEAEPQDRQMSSHFDGKSHRTNFTINSYQIQTSFMTDPLTALSSPPSRLGVRSRTERKGANVRRVSKLLNYHNFSTCLTFSTELVQTFPWTRL